MLTYEVWAIACLGAALRAGADAGDQFCSWCEAGSAQCDLNYSKYDLGIFPTSIGAAVGGRGFPYFHPSAQAPFHATVADRPNTEVTLAVIVHHGAARNADGYCSYMTNAVLKHGGNLKSTLIIAPQIFEVGDTLLDDSTMLWWNSNSDDGLDEDGGERDWKWGGNSTSDLPASISAFSVLDEMVLLLADRTRFPRLSRLVLAGHSAGGQIIQRYALFSVIGVGGARHDRMPVDLEVSYFVANPSSTTYLGPERPITGAMFDRDCDFCANATIQHQTWNFSVPSRDSAGWECLDTYNKYGYGLDGILPDYPAATTADAARIQYGLRNVTYLSGESDVCDVPFMTENECLDCQVQDGGLDTSCGAYAQGWCRMARLHAFAQYVNIVYYKRPVHSLVSVPHVGHSGCGIFQSKEFAVAARLPFSCKFAGGNALLDEVGIADSALALIIVGAAAVSVLFCLFCYFGRKKYNLLKSMPYEPVYAFSSESDIELRKSAQLGSNRSSNNAIVDRSILNADDAPDSYDDNAY